MESDSEEELLPISVADQSYLASVFNYNDAFVTSGILRAIEEENLDKLKILVELGKSVNINDNYGNTPLHIAVIKNNLNIIKYLLSQDTIVVNVRNFRGETPLFKAVRKALLEVISLLIHCGANVNLPNYEDITPLHKSVFYPDIAQVLIIHGANMNAVDYSGDMPLHDAVAEGCLETVCLFLYYNVDANAPGGNNLTPFMKALISRNIRIQDALFEYVNNFNTYTDDCMSTLALALINNSPYVEEIINRGADVNYSNCFTDSEETCPFNLCLQMPNINNFKAVWNRLKYNRVNMINLCSFFEYLEDDIEKYIQIIIDSDNFIPAVKSFIKNENYFLFIVKFAEHELHLEQLTVLTFCLLCQGYRINSYDIYEIFRHYGYCELIRILCFMNNDFTRGWHTYMLVPRLIFDLNCNLQNKLDNLHEFHENDIQQLLEYFIYPPLMNKLMSMYRDNPIMFENLVNLPRVPSLTEIARNKARKHIYTSFRISTTCQFYTIINHLDISPVYKKILTFEKKLYVLKNYVPDMRFSC